MPNPFWQYFLVLETDLDSTVRYVEPAEENYATFSTEFSRILLSASSELDVVCRVLSKRVQATAKPRNFTQLRKIILSEYPELPSLQVHVPRYGLAFAPLAAWLTQETPNWWRSYNDVKHKRYRHFADANLRNALNSMGGLFVIELYLHQEDLYNGALRPWPRLLDIESNTGAFCSVGGFPMLPDFPLR